MRQQLERTEYKEEQEVRIEDSRQQLERVEVRSSSNDSGQDGNVKDCLQYRYILSLHWTGTANI